MAKGRGRAHTPARSAKQVTKRRNREADPRWQRAKEEQLEAERQLRELQENSAKFEDTSADALRKTILAAREKAELEMAVVEREIEEEEHLVFYCPQCSRGSSLPDALDEGYCSFCIDWTGEPVRKPEAAEKKKNPTAGLPLQGEGKPGTMPLNWWRARLRHGYNIRTVVTESGFGLEKFEGCQWDEDGFGIDHLDKPLPKAKGLSK